MQTPIPPLSAVYVEGAAHRRKALFALLGAALLLTLLAVYVLSRRESSPAERFRQGEELRADERAALLTSLAESDNSRAAAAMRADERGKALEKAASSGNTKRALELDVEERLSLIRVLRKE